MKETENNFLGNAQNVSLRILLDVTTTCWVAVEGYPPWKKEKKKHFFTKNKIIFACCMSVLF